MAEQIVKFPQLDVAPVASINSVSFFVGYIDNEDGSFSDYKFTVDQIIAGVLDLTQKKFLSPSTGNTITLSWFSGKQIGTLYFNNQVYFSGDDFDQNDDTITLKNQIGVITGQQIKAETI